MTVLMTYFTVSILNPNYKFSPSGTYYAPAQTEYKGYLEYINTLPLIAQPEVSRCVVNVLYPTFLVCWPAFYYVSAAFQLVPATSL